MPRNTFAPSRPRNESQKSSAAQPQSSSKTKSGSLSSQSSLTRRNSAPLLGAFGSQGKAQVRTRPKIDTSLTYQRPGMSPVIKPLTPLGQLSTFGTPYNSSWETSRTESIPRPSTAPLPDDDDDLVGGVHYTTYGSRNSQVYEAPFSDISVPVPPEMLAQAENDLARSEKEKGKGHRRSGSALLRMVGVEPVAPEVEHKEHGRPRRLTLNSMMHPASSAITHQASQNSLAHTVNSGTGTESTRGTTSAEDTTLISMSRFPLPPDSGTPRTPGTVMGTPTTATMGTPTVAGTPTLAVTPTIGGSFNRSGTPTTGRTPRPNTPGSMVTIHPNTPSTPAIPEFLAASRTTPEELSAHSTPNDSRPGTSNGSYSDAPKPRLRTRSSLLTLAISAAAMVGVDMEGTASDSKTEAISKTEQPVETPKTERAFEFTFPLPDAMKANSPQATSQPETTSSDPHAEPIKPESQSQARARPDPSDPSNPRRRSLLERLTARIATPVPETTIEDITWNSVSSDWTDAEDTRQLRPGPVIDFDLAPEEPLIDMDRFGLVGDTWSPVRQGATFPPMASTPRTAFPISHSAPLSPTCDGAQSPTNEDPLLPQEPVSPTRARTRTLSKLSMTGRKVLTLGGRPSGRDAFSNTSKASRRSRRRAHGRGMSGESIPTRLREDGRLESLTRRASADALSIEGTMEGTVLYGVGEEMLRLMFANGAASSTEESEERDQLLPVQAQTSHGHVTSSQNLMPENEERERERTRSLPRPHANLVSSPVDEGKNPDLGSLSYSSVIMPLNIRPKGHRRGTASKENASLDKSRLSVDQKVRLSLEYKPRPGKSRTRTKSAPLGISQQRKSVEVVGILTNGNNSGRTTPNYTLGRGAGRVVIVNSATIPNGMGTPTRKTTRSSPVPASDIETSQVLVQPGVIVTAATPPAPRRSLSMPIESLPTVEGSETGVESPRGTVSRGTSVQFVPESFEGRRRGGRSRKDSANALIPPVPEVNGNGKGKRKVEREPTDTSDTSAKKPRLSVDEMDITFMGEPLFGGQPQHRRGGLGSQASSHPSTYSRHSQSYSRHSQSYSRHSQSYNAPYPYPSPASSPEPGHTSIPMHAIFTPRVQSLYGTGAKSDYAPNRQSVSSIPRPKSRASARSNATGAKSYRSNMTGARSNMTGARSNKTSASQRGPTRWQDKLPIQGWCFLVGFIFPFAWWYAAFARAEKGYYGGGIWSRDVETQWEGVRTDVHREDGRIDAHTWRFRCRLMTALSIVIYIPVIVLAAVFA
ncbi:unnamed protein product [Rhizoctonia solani]|uniref:Mucin-2 n=1 Tax=Rhizoctonia solani TaxID=456999 RepID=A0A8H2WHR1_9AGAM|nr:unnamed protein product [Rhizoctonia solani]